MNRHGIDVSQHQGSIDWQQAAPEVGFVFVKATEGLGYVDPTFSKGRVHALREAGIIWGAYHFARPQPNRDGGTEAEFFIRTVRAAGGWRDGDLPGVLDLETSEGVSRRDVRRFRRRFVKRYRELLRHRPIIYTGSFWRDFLGNPVTLSRCRLFLAAYVTDWRPYLPRAWRFATFWQYGAKGRCPGVRGDVDVDVFLRRPKAFQRMRIGQRRRRRR